MNFRNHTAALSWRHGRRVRFVLAACCVALAIVSLTNQSDRAQERAVPVAARDLPSGATIAAEDVTAAMSDLPLDTPPAEELAGEIVRGPVAAGEPLTRSRLVPGRALRPPAGTVVFPLTVADERIAELLNAGDRVDVLVSPDTLHAARPRVAARDVEVLAVPSREGSGPVSPQAGALILLALDDAAAEELAGMRRSDHVTVAIR